MLYVLQYVFRCIESILLTASLSPSVVLRLQLLPKMLFVSKLQALQEFNGYKSNEQLKKDRLAVINLKFLPPTPPPSLSPPEVVYSSTKSKSILPLLPPPSLDLLHLHLHPPPSLFSRQICRLSDTKVFRLTFLYLFAPGKM